MDLPKLHSQTQLIASHLIYIIFAQTTHPFASGQDLSECGIAAVSE